MEVAHTGVGDDLDAFFNKYGTGDLGGWIPVFLKIVAEKVHLQQKSEFPHVDPDDPEALITLLPATCKIILISDWGANNDHAANVEFGNLAWPTSAVCFGPPPGTLLLRELGSAGAKPGGRSGSRT